MKGGVGVTFLIGGTLWGLTTMTFEIIVNRVTITKSGWETRVHLGNGEYTAYAEYKDGKLKFRSEKSSIKNEPVSWDTILEKVEELVEGVEIPEVETGKFGDIKND